MGPQLLHDDIDYFDRLEAACRQALARGVPADAGVIDLVGLSYNAAVPDGDRWRNVHDYYRRDGHARQLRHMLASLAEG